MCITKCDGYGKPFPQISQKYIGPLQFGDFTDDIKSGADVILSVVDDIISAVGDTIFSVDDIISGKSG